MPLNPYSRLKADFQKFIAQIDDVRGSSTRSFWWSVESVDDRTGAGNLRDIREQVKAARVLGKETVVFENSGALEFHFRNKIPQTPFV